MKQNFYLTLGLLMALSCFAKDKPELVIAKMDDCAACETQVIQWHIKGQEYTFNVAKEPSNTGQDVVSVALVQGESPRINFDLSEQRYVKLSELTVRPREADCSDVEW